MKKISLTLLFIALLTCSAVLATEITGPSTANVNETKTYNFDNGFSLKRPVWSPTGGTVVSTSNNGTNYSADIQWTSAGSQTLSLSHDFGFLDSHAVTVSYPLLTGGSISGTQTICYYADVAAFGNAASASGGTGSYNYQWQWRTPGGSWFDIPGATSSTYNHGNLNATKEFRREVTSGTQTAYSNTLTVTVYPNLNAGTIASSQTICSNCDVAAFTNTASASGGNGSYNYQWQWRSPGGSWSNISGATSTTYNHGNLSTTKEFRRRAISCGQTKYSSVLTVTVQ